MKEKKGAKAKIFLFTSNYNVAHLYKPFQKHFQCGLRPREHNGYLIYLRRREDT